MMTWDRFCHPKGMGGLTNPDSRGLALPKLRKLWKMVLFGSLVMGKRSMYSMIGGVSRVFGWTVGHEIFPTYNKIARILQEFVRKCPQCDTNEETLINALKDYPSTRDILIYRGLDNRLLNGNYIRCIDWLEDAFRIMDAKAAADFLTFL
ncbi:hypothetical protein PVK06_001975 [Gossypium arboreum]|uniref:Uncharacterized protein n=1 Tax=Gossypium arboreum TaxID=29729 RepID=A0ABR0R2E4_GOSAR|nr:hypothetical protein PVK06_001975 [Gossypium arboreum]